MHNILAQLTKDTNNVNTTIAVPNSILRLFSLTRLTENDFFVLAYLCLRIIDEINNCTSDYKIHTTENETNFK